MGSLHFWKVYLIFKVSDVQLFIHGYFGVKIKWIIFVRGQVTRIRILSLEIVFFFSILIVLVKN